MVVFDTCITPRKYWQELVIILRVILHMNITSMKILGIDIYRGRIVILFPYFF
jgi:hypothetical protein